MVKVKLFRDGVDDYDRSIEGIPEIKNIELKGRVTGTSNYFVTDIHGGEEGMKTL